MTRRIAVAVATVAALGVAAAPASAAKNQIRIVGGVVVKPGKYVKDNQRFSQANYTVKSGATVKIVDKSTLGEPHTVSFIKKSLLPEMFETPAFGPLMAAHGATEDGPPTVPVVDNGQPLAEGATLEVDTMGDATTAGDSVALGPKQPFSFKVTARKGSKLHFFCAIHPWMQSKLTVN